jgi:hypothetical protein
VTVFAIDPGTTESAVVGLYPDGAIRGWFGLNGALLEMLKGQAGGHLVIEQVESMGMAVGAEVFETVFWSGRFAEAWGGASWSRLPRRAVKLALCGRMQAKDPNIRQALIDRFGGEASRKKGGALHGIKSHMWAALAVGVVYQQLEGEKQHGITGHAAGIVGSGIRAGADPV